MKHKHKISKHVLSSSLIRYLIFSRQTIFDIFFIIAHYIVVAHLTTIRVFRYVRRQRVMLDDDLNRSDNIVGYYFVSLSLSAYVTFYSLALFYAFSLSPSFTFSLSFSRLRDQTSHNRERSKSVSRLIESENHDYPVQRYKWSYVTPAIFMGCQARTERVKVLFKDDRTHRTSNGARLQVKSFCSKQNTSLMGVRRKPKGNRK